MPFLFRVLLILVALTGLSVFKVFGQSDTIKVSLSEFLDLAKSQSTLLNARQTEVDFSINRVNQARAQRILPRIELNTAHGLVPAVTSSDPNLPPGQYYLDPNLKNDWYNWGIFTRAEITSLQPIYTWGAIDNAINAARQGVIAAEAGFEAQTSSYEERLTELYFSRLLAMELNRLVTNAHDQLEDAEEQLNEMIEEGDTEIEESDVFEFKIFKFEFLSRVEEVRQNLLFTEAAWNLALNNRAQEVTYTPESPFLDQIDFQMMDVLYYEEQARATRPELRQIQAAYNAARYGLQANKAANYPSFFMGLSASVAYTPNRPKQNNPFIINSTNYASVSYGFGFRQNLNFLTNRVSIDRAEIQVRQARYAQEAALDGIMLEIREKYRNMMMSYSKLDNTREAFQISTEWLRLEQIDYDLGFGDVKKLIDAVQKNLELEAALKQRIFDFNVNVMKLNRAAGLPITESN
jgi:outer membrane protein TolC